MTQEEGGQAQEEAEVESGGQGVPMLSLSWLLSSALQLLVDTFWYLCCLELIPWLTHAPCSLNRKPSGMSALGNTLNCATNSIIAEQFLSKKVYDLQKNSDHDIP